MITGRYEHLFLVVFLNKKLYLFIAGAFTHHIEVDHGSLVSRTPVQRAVLSNIVLPRTMEVIGHDVEVVKHTDNTDMRINVK